MPIKWAIGIARMLALGLVPALFPAPLVRFCWPRSSPVLSARRLDRGRPPLLLHSVQSFKPLIDLRHDILPYLGPIWFAGPRVRACSLVGCRVPSRVGFGPWNRRLSVVRGPLTVVGLSAGHGVGLGRRLAVLTYKGQRTRDKGRIRVGFGPWNRRLSFVPCPLSFVGRFVEQNARFRRLSVVGNPLTVVGLSAGYGVGLGRRLAVLTYNGQRTTDHGQIFNGQRTTDNGRVLEALTHFDECVERVVDQPCRREHVAAQLVAFWAGVEGKAVGHLGRVGFGDLVVTRRISSSRDVWRSTSAPSTARAESASGGVNFDIRRRLSSLS